MLSRDTIEAFESEVEHRCAMRFLPTYWRGLFEEDEIKSLGINIIIPVSTSKVERAWGVLSVDAKPKFHYAHFVLTPLKTKPTLYAYKYAGTDEDRTILPS